MNSSFFVDDDDDCTRVHGWKGFCFYLEQTPPKPGQVKGGFSSSTSEFLFEVPTSYVKGHKCKCITKHCKRTQKVGVNKKT